MKKEYKKFLLSGTINMFIVAFVLHLFKKGIFSTKNIFLIILIFILMLFIEYVKNELIDKYFDDSK